MAGLVVAWTAAAVISLAQTPPGEPGDPSGPGWPGSRGQQSGANVPFEFGGPGAADGFASDLFRLANNETVQTELKLTDRQKAIIKRVSGDQSKKRTEFFQEFRKQSDAARAQAVQDAQAQALAGNQVDPSVDARGSGAGNPIYGALNSRGYQPRIYGGQPQIDPTARQQAARLQGQMAGDTVQNESRQMMREAMQKFQQESQHELARVLDKAQYKRLREIQLQLEGAGAVLRDEVSEKLGLDEDQRAEIQNILNQTNAARRDLMRKNWDFMRLQMPTLPVDPDQAAALGQPDNPPDARNGAGGRGTPGRFDPEAMPFDPEAMRKVMEQPEVKAKMDETRKEQRQLREREYAMVYKAMDRRQVATFKRLLGKPFDVDSLIGGFFRGSSGGRRNEPSPASDQAKTRTKPISSPASAADSGSSATPASKPAATPRRQSLRERRGLGGQQPSTDSPPN
jgi:hypothetical protein